MRTTRVVTVGSLAASTVAVTLWLSSTYAFIGIGAPEAARATRPPPLLGADGTPQPALPQAVPADPGARTQAALYATREQAQALEADLDGAVIWFDIDGWDDGAIGEAIERADSLRTRRHLALDAPVFITGRRLHRAALVADRLTNDGYTQVFLVTR
jgi:hypothetical protein